MKARFIKSQSSVEFVVILCLVLVFFVLLLSFLSDRTDEVLGAHQQVQLEYVLDVVEKELLIAKDVPGNYDRTFTLPKLDNMDYTFRVVQGREIVLDSNDREIVRFLTSDSFIYTNFSGVSSGDDLKVIKKGSQICLSQTSCNFGGNGSFQCDSSGYWDDCDFRFGDTIDAVRYDCGVSATSGLLEFTALDDSYIALSEVGVGDGSGLFEFKNLDFKVNESGAWNLSVYCTGGLDDSKIKIVPYGYFTFFPIEKMSGCRSNSTTGLFDCKANENFTLAVELKCHGGECGDANIWIDP